jgi:hypothetical protein
MVTPGRRDRIDVDRVGVDRPRPPTLPSSTDLINATCRYDFYA